MDNPSTLQRLRHRAALALLTLREHLTPPADTPESDFLPDFCRGWVVFNVVVVAELVAIVINLLLPQGLLTPHAALDLLVVSVFVQWVALTGTAVLCRLRGFLNRLPNLRATALAYLILLGVTLLVGELAMLLLWISGKSPTWHPLWYGNFQIFSLTISAIVHGILLRYFLARHEAVQRTRAEARARIQAQLARIRPHFVFNALNIIASLTRTDPHKAETAIEDMADLFRMMLSEDEMLVPVRNEIDVAKKYLALESLRLDARLKVNWDIGTYPRKAVMPVLMLQPILEFLIRYGIEDRTEGGTVDVQLREEGDNIHLRVSAPGARTRARQHDATADRTLESIRLRLQNHYGSAATLECNEQDGRAVVTAVTPTRGGTP